MIMKSLVVPSAISLFLLEFHAVYAFCGYQCQTLPRLCTMFRNSKSFIPNQSKESEDPLDEEMMARMMEIEAMGGDPFFMTEEVDDGPESPDDDDVEDLQVASEMMAKMAMSGAADVLSVVQERFATDGLGPSPKTQESTEFDDPGWEWDGTVNEDAHLDLD